MRNNRELKKILMLCYESLSEGFDKACNLIDELLKKGKITVRESKYLKREVFRKYINNIKENKVFNNIKNKSIKVMDNAIEKAGLVKKSDFESLKKELNELKNKINTKL